MYQRLIILVIIVISINGEITEDAKEVQNKLEELESNLSSLKDSYIKEANQNIGYKGNQAQQRGPKSVKCAKQAGEKYMNDVKSTVTELEKLKDDISGSRKQIENGDLSAKGVEKLKISASKGGELFERFQETIVSVGAKVEVLSKQYALTANDC